MTLMEDVVASHKSKIFIFLVCSCGIKRDRFYINRYYLCAYIKFLKKNLFIRPSK